MNVLADSVTTESSTTTAQDAGLRPRVRVDDARNDGARAIGTRAKHPGTARPSRSSSEGRSGHGELVARARRDGHGALRTTLATARASSPLRFVRPTFPGSRASSVCLVTFGGGLVDGDFIDLDVTVEAGATLVVFTQATTKAFRGSSGQALRATVHGTLVLLPDPVACFRGARYRQRVDIALHGEGSCVVLDGFTSGRAAYGDRWAFDGFETRTTIVRDERVVLRDAMRLDVRDGDVAERMDRFEAYASLMAIGSRVEPIVRGVADRSRASPTSAPRRAAPAALAPAPRDLVASPCPLPRIDDGAMVRVVGTSPSAVLAEVRRRLRNLPDIDVVDPFASRL